MENQEKRSYSSLKCWLGSHVYELVDTITMVHPEFGVEYKKIYVSRCLECGKVVSVEVDYGNIHFPIDLKTPTRSSKVSIIQRYKPSDNDSSEEEK